ncbi:Protein CBG25872 [Caenorhabditis briggsae]|uniref:Protein CBG25872 n=1 Tax=Caenorhabditis briggsae TaxID=6238 RepID=B6IIU9_CAEBR|nr:Protein CBG25872 [Caenorhabditis briggsae]CAR99829.1 Protein CBG25872 [Caenorhabditis briggsae]
MKNSSNSKKKKK